MSGGTSAVAIAATVASTAMSVKGQMDQQSAAAGQASRSQAQGVYAAQQAAAQQSAQAAYERDIADQNITLAGRRADLARAFAEIPKAASRDATARGEVEVDRLRLATKQRAGTQRAILAAQGTDLAGSPTDILADTAGAGEFDVLTARANAAREAYGYDLAAYETGVLGVYQADLDKTRAMNDRAMAQFKQDNARPGAVSVDYTPSYAGAASSALAGASNLAEKWWKFQQNDPGGGVFASSPTATMDAYRSLPASSRVPGFESLIS